MAFLGDVTASYRIFLNFRGRHVLVIMVMGGLHGMGMHGAVLRPASHTAFQ